MDRTMDTPAPAANSWGYGANIGVESQNEMVGADPEPRPLGS